MSIVPEQNETVSTAKDLCRAYMTADIPTFLHGPPGVGKSDLWRQLAEEREIGFIDIRLGQKDPVDLTGLPSITKGENENLTTWARPDELPRLDRDGPAGVILFDELSDAPRAMQSAAYQLILNRRVGPHVIPPGWYPCAAGNRRSDRAAAGAVSLALANRFAHITIEANVDAFKDWAYTHGISPLILGFLSFRKELLHQMPDGERYAFPSPRSWAQASKICHHKSDIRSRLMAGLVGPGAAAEFENFMAVTDLPEVADIVANPKTCHIPSNPSARYAVGALLACDATPENFDAIYVYTSRPEFGADYHVCCITDCCKRNSSLTNTPTFLEKFARTVAAPLKG